MEILWPVGKFSDAVFKMLLENIIVNQLNVEALADEIRKNEEATVTNLDINTTYFNENFFVNSPLKLLKGKIMSIRARFPKNFVNKKIEVIFSDIYIIMAPSNRVFQQTPQEIKAESKDKKQNVILILFSRLMELLIRLCIMLKLL